MCGVEKGGKDNNKSLKKAKFQWIKSINTPHMRNSANLFYKEIVHGISKRFVLLGNYAV